ncbi:FbpB family small basic protein [Cytobacillus dafuensis]|uniref:FbpB family small basic protein n=1 Tax=Cytobacillus dafuensis TaxID=1742359 RepID=A0A5B8Z0S7_CYTDA|nr:FbpB family small basic protein [Cytobacillus dafuensis]QED46508.1 FbpB family small basic protein [Cytobacillus dafuensis]
MKRKKLSFNRLMEENREEILKDEYVLERIEKKLDKKHEDTLKKQQQVLSNN